MHAYTHLFLHIYMCMYMYLNKHVYMYKYGYMYYSIMYTYMYMYVYVVLQIIQDIEGHYFDEGDVDCCQHELEVSVYTLPVFLECIVEHLKTP